MLIREVDISAKRGWMPALSQRVPGGAFLRCSDVSSEYVGTWPAGYTAACDCARCEVWTGCDKCFEHLPHVHESPTRTRILREFPAVDGSDMRKPRFEDPPRPLGMGAILPASAVPSAVMTSSSEAIARGLFRVRMRDLIDLRGEAAHCHKAYEWPQRIRAEAVLWEKEFAARAECEAQAKALVEEMERWQHVVSANGLIAVQPIRELSRTVARVELDDEDEFSDDYSNNDERDEFADE